MDQQLEMTTKLYLPVNRLRKIKANINYVDEILSTGKNEAQKTQDIRTI